MSTHAHDSAAPATISSARELIDYAKTLDCIHCGLCLNTCPTYRLTGAEPSSPRGRIHLMRAVAEGQIEAGASYAEELDFCLLCRHCESVCPSGVQFGAMMEHARGALEPQRERSALSRLARRIGFDLVLRNRAVLRATAYIGRFAQTSGLVRVIARVSGSNGRALLQAPLVPPARERRRLAAHTKAIGTRRGAVALLEGCVMPELLGRTNRATVALLTRLGFDSYVASEHVCCGSLHAHNGETSGARELARETIAAYERLVDAEGRALTLVVNSAGCGAHLKELATLFADEPEWHARAVRLSQRTLDLTQFLTRGVGAEAIEAAFARIAPAQSKMRATWDDPCHLCHGQGVRREPRTLLRRVTGLELVEMPDSESCCGSAGIYSLLRPDDARNVLAPKLESLRASGARLLVTANPGCQLQWAQGIAAAGLDVRVAHIAEVLDEALTTEPRRVI